MNDRPDHEDVALIIGTPKLPLGSAAIFVELWRTMKEERDERWRSQPMASMCLVRPDRAGYVVNPLVSNAEITPEAALAGALVTARARKVAEVYVNGDLDRIPAPPAAD